MNINYKHFSKLISFPYKPQKIVGFGPYQYARGLLCEVTDCTFEHLPEKAISREGVFSLIEDHKISTSTCCVAVLSWGGMRRSHARTVLQAPECWFSIADELRAGLISRSEAYKRFEALRYSGRLPGMGPAFFTKIIYFFSGQSKSRGYIMDQWTAKSTNLLLGRKLVDLLETKAGAMVSDKNTAKCYDEFCDFIEVLAQKMGVVSDVAEEMIFSNGNKGRSPTRGEWRSYVIGQYENFSKRA